MFGELNITGVLAQQPGGGGWSATAPQRTQAPDQSTSTLQYAPSAVATRTLAPAVDMSSRGVVPSQGGEGLTTLGPAPGCLSSAQVALLVNCAANPSPDCAALMASSGLPLCPGDKLPLPQCKDDQVVAQLSYCDTYGPSGPDPVKNAFCWAATKDAAWYAGMKALPPCPGSEAEKKKKMLMWGGILLGVAVLGGVGYWYATKKP